MGKRRLRARWDFPRIWFSTSAVPRAAVRGKLLRLEEETFAGTMGQAVLVAREWYIWIVNVSKE